MAKADYTVADRAPFSIQAGDKVLETVQETPDADAAEFAATEGVSHPAYANYVEALETHQTRADIEPLADRRAREYGADFAAGDFMRQRAYDENGAATAPPRPGTIYGDAPKSSETLLDRDRDGITADTDTDE